MLRSAARSFSRTIETALATDHKRRRMVLVKKQSIFGNHRSSVVGLQASKVDAAFEIIPKSSRIFMDVEGAKRC